MEKLNLCTTGLHLWSNGNINNGKHNSITMLVEFIQSAIIKDANLCLEDLIEKMSNLVSEVQPKKRVLQESLHFKLPDAQQQSKSSVPRTTCCKQR